MTPKERKKEVVRLMTEVEQMSIRCAVMTDTITKHIEQINKLLDDGLKSGDSYGDWCKEQTEGK